MAELSEADVESFTRGRLLASDGETKKMLDAALLTARRYCGWKVTPVVTDDVMVLDGPDSRILNLPTRKLVTLSELFERGNPVDLSKVRWSAGGPPGSSSRPIAVRKRNGGWWTGEYQGIEVKMTHGYTEAEAADWRLAVLSMVDQMSQTLASGRGELDLLSKKVDDVTYRWGDPYADSAQQALFSVTRVFDNFTLPCVEFL
ncbi:head-to-tail adaptor [Mycobacterium phage Krili]|nr:head-to-tail adaptor [Mycobacterium phage Krili]